MNYLNGASCYFIIPLFIFCDHSICSLQIHLLFDHSVYLILMSLVILMSLIVILHSRRIYNLVFFCLVLWSLLGYMYITIFWGIGKNLFISMWTALKLSLNVITSWKSILQGRRFSSNKITSINLIKWFHT